MGKMGEQVGFLRELTSDPLIDAQQVLESDLAVEALVDGLIDRPKASGRNQTDHALAFVNLRMRT